MKRPIQKFVAFVAAVMAITTPVLAQEELPDTCLESARSVVYKVDVDKCREIAQAIGISSIPAILYIPADGKDAVMTVGARGKEQFKSEIAKYLLK